MHQKSNILLLHLALVGVHAAAADNATVAACGGDYDYPQVVCINRYGSKLPVDFNRQVNYATGEDTWGSTSVPGDASFVDLQNATFIVLDKERGLDLLGASPSYEFMFSTTAAHEAPVYVPDTNELWFGQTANGVTAQKVVDLSASPPTLSERTFDPPIYAPVGGRYHGGQVYFAAAGGSSTLAGGPYHPGIYSVDPKTGKSTTLVNNYYGYYFNTVDDLDIDADGRIWFTDPLASRNFAVNEFAPQMQAASYRFDPATGAVNIVEDTLGFPNGISFSSDHSKVYFTDTSAGVPMIDPHVSFENAGYLTYNSTNKRTLYAYDVSSDGLYLLNRRPIYNAIEYVPDGLKVASNGYILTGAGHGIDILDSNGTPLLRIQTAFLAVNVAFAGANLDELWIVGHGGVARAKINLTGISLS